MKRVLWGSIFTLCLGLVCILVGKWSWVMANWENLLTTLGIILLACGGLSTLITLMTMLDSSE